MYDDSHQNDELKSDQIDLFIPWYDFYSKLKFLYQTTVRGLAFWIGVWFGPTSYMLCKYVGRFIGSNDNLEKCYC